MMHDNVVYMCWIVSLFFLSVYGIFWMHTCISVVMHTRSMQWIVICWTFTVFLPWLDVVLSNVLHHCCYLYLHFMKLCVFSKI